jgi:hypothetical protein
MVGPMRCWAAIAEPPATNGHHRTLITAFVFNNAGVGLCVRREGSRTSGRDPAESSGPFLRSLGYSSSFTARKTATPAT